MVEIKNEYIHPIDQPIDADLLASGRLFRGGLTVDDPKTGLPMTDERGGQLVKEIVLSAADETAERAEWAQVAQDQADYITNEKYKDDRSKAYGPVEDQLDMMYWDKVNGTAVWVDHVAAVRAAHPKP